MQAPTSLGRELLFYFAVLLGGAVLLSSVGLMLALPVLETPQTAVSFIFALLVLDLVVLFAAGSALLRRSLLRPLERLVEDARRIEGGDYLHRMGAAPTVELQVLSDTVNAMARRLIRDQELLAENIRSLDESNRELVEAQEQLVRTARLASVGTLASGIAHEVGNPLGAIIGYVDVARSRALKQGADTELLDSVSEEALRIDRIVRGLLDYARPGKRETRPVSARELFDRVRELLEAQGRLGRVSTTWVVRGEVPPLLADLHRLEQVMVNLLLNAVQALEGRADGRIEVAAEARPGEARLMPTRRESDPPGINYAHRRRVRHERGGLAFDPLLAARTVVVLTVSDNGGGIPEEHLARVFDPFFTTKAPGKGTGLGLAVCAQLVDGMGGRITVANGPEGGALFEVRLPGLDPDGEHPATPTAKRADAVGSGEARRRGRPS